MDNQIKEHERKKKLYEVELKEKQSQNEKKLEEDKK